MSHDSATRPRVLLYVEAPVTGGVTTMITALAAGLVNLDPVCVIHSGPKALPAWEKCLQMQGIPNKPLAFHSPSELRCWFELLRAFRLFREFRTAGVIHIHLHTVHSCLPAMLLAALAHPPALVITEHYIAQLPFLGRRKRRFPIALVRGVWLAVLGSAKRMLLRRVHRIVTVSRANEQTLLGEYGSAVREKTLTIPNGIDPAPFYRTGPATLPHDIPVPSSTRFLVAVVAGMNNQKGHKYLLDAIPAVLRRYPSTAFLLVGDGHLRPQLQATAEALGIRDVCVFTGVRNDVAAILHASHVFVLPSLFEGMPMSVMEAMAAGCPVIATNVGGSAELVTDHESGILVPPAESAPLADAIIELLGDTGARTRFAERAKVLLQTQFTARTMVQAYRQMYAKASPAGGRITSHRHGALDRKSQ